VLDFETFYRAQYHRVYVGCVVLGGTASLSREATDEAFARALERWATVGVMHSPGGWVQVVARNELRHLLRRARLERLTSLGFVPAVEAPGLPDAEVWAAVRRLPGRQQTAVVLRYLHDLPEAEVAEAMGIARGTVSATLATARARLRAQLGGVTAETVEPEQEELRWLH
jgi:DNA-directed RNA polymerase specialized sigma24 family protein